MGSSVEAANYSAFNLPRDGMTFSPDGLELNGDSWRSAWRLRSAGYGDGRRQAKTFANGMRPNSGTAKPHRVVRERRGLIGWASLRAIHLERGGRVKSCA
jgi:hypothetical protein